jgi:hypothetical protein
MHPWWGVRIGRLDMKRSILKLAVAVASLGVVTIGASEVRAVDPPVIQPTADCVQRSWWFDTYWFGYDSSVAFRDMDINVNVGVNNSFRETRNGRTFSNAANRGQVTNFHRGSHRKAFAVTTWHGNALTWTVTAGQNGGALFTAAATTTAATPACPKGTPVASATAQGTDPSATLSAGPTRALNEAGLLVAADRTVTVTGVSSACSIGSPLPPRVVYGYIDEPNNNLVPLAAGEIIRTETIGPAFNQVVVQWSANPTRKIIDPQVPGTVGFGHDVIGLSTGGGLVDVIGRCQIGPWVIESTESSLWLDFYGNSVTGTYFVTDPTTQTVVLYECVPTPAAPSCTFGPRGVPIR